MHRKKHQLAQFAEKQRIFSHVRSRSEPKIMGRNSLQKFGASSQSDSSESDNSASSDFSDGSDRGTNRAKFGPKACMEYPEE